MKINLRFVNESMCCVSMKIQPEVLQMIATERPLVTNLNHSGLADKIFLPSHSPKKTTLNDESSR